MLVGCWLHLFMFVVKKKTAYEMRISDWSAELCSSDLPGKGAGANCSRMSSSVCSRLRTRAIHDRRWLAVGQGHSAIPNSCPAFTCALPLRSEERRVGKECVSTCRSRWSPYH